MDKQVVENLGEETGQGPKACTWLKQQAGLDPRGPIWCTSTLSNKVRVGCRLCMGRLVPNIKTQGVGDHGFHLHLVLSDFPKTKT